MFVKLTKDWDGKKAGQQLELSKADAEKLIADGTAEAVEQNLVDDTVKKLVAALGERLDNMEKALNAQPRGRVGQGDAVPGAANNFVSPQTALSFPVASGAITAAWKIFGQLYAPLGDTAYLPVAMSVIVGIAFYVASNEKGKTWSDRIPVIAAAFFNTFTLAAAVLGLNQVIVNRPGAPAPHP